jgi:hypothetical protein
VLLIASGDVPARSQDASASLCPSGYWRYDSVCVNDVTGDVFYASVSKRL